MRAITNKDFVKQLDDDGDVYYIFRTEAFLTPSFMPIISNTEEITEWKLWMQTNTKKPMEELVEKLRDYANIIEKFMVNKND